MIIPQNRLLWLFALTVLPMTLAGSAIPAVASATWITVTALFTLCLFDGLWIMGNAGSLRMELPEKLQLIRNREDHLALRLHDVRGKVRKLSVAIELPPGVISSREEFSVSFPSNGSKLDIRWPITGVTRGESVIPRCHFRIPSRMGLWCVQSCREAGTRLLVYPNLTTSPKDTNALLLSLNQTGRRALRQVGQGRELEKVRDYLPGDSMTDVHWRLTARRGRLVTKEFQLEQTQEIYVIIDASRLSARQVPIDAGNGAERLEPVLERSIVAALTLGTIAARQGDRYGLLTCADGVLDFVRAGMGPGHFRICRDRLMHLQSQLVSPDFEELAGFLVQNLRRRALILFLTHLDDPSLADAFVRSMGPVSRQHLVLVAMVRPSAVNPVFSEGQVTEPEDLYRSLGGHLVWQNLRELEIVLRRRGMGLSVVAHEQLCPEVVSQYLKVKQRQIL